MSQITRTTNDLIVSALQFIGEFGADEVPDAYAMAIGLDIVNELLDKFSSSGILIPFYKTISFNMVPNQKAYIFSNVNFPGIIFSNPIVDLVFASYTIEQEITYPIQVVDEATYYLLTRIDSAYTRPALAFLDKQSQGSLVTFYPAPDMAYACSLRVRVMLDSLGAYDDLTELPPYYYGFMRYAVARKLISFYPSANWPPEAESEYQEYWAMIKPPNNIDVSIRPSNLLVNNYEANSYPSILVY